MKNLKPLSQKQLQQRKKPKLSKILLGIDEVGRGPWAGPLVIGAVIFRDRDESWINQLTDSKKLTPKKRRDLNALILENSITGLGWVSASELDRYGLSNALKLAARRAVKNVLAQKATFSEIIIDGTVNFLTDTPLADKVTILKKADLLVQEVSAASIIAKVARDNYMIQLAERYPEYNFERHVGYGTAAHKQALLQYGICPEHRKSFRPIQEILAASQQLSSSLNRISSHLRPITTTTSGTHAEDIVAVHLQSLHHKIIARNFKTKTYEIDIISTLDQRIYFTEVKYRKNSDHGTPLAQITAKKRQQMQYAAQKFFSTHPEYQEFQPLLAVSGVTGLDYTLTGWGILHD